MDARTKDEMEARTKDATNLQKELGDIYKHAGDAWFERMRSETELWSALAAKLSTAHSVPEAMEVYQKGVAQRMQMAAEDGRQLLDDYRNITEKVTRAMSRGMLSMSNGMSSPGNTYRSNMREKAA
jgi:hypothetical protein